MNLNLENKKILITGSSGGIGSAICKKFIDNKCKIIFTSSKDEKLSALRNDFGTTHSYYKLDLLDSEHLQKNINIISEENKG